jgi:MFS family permease
VLLFALAAPLPLGAVLAASAFAGACLELTEVCWGATLAQQIPPHRLSRIASYDQFGGLALSPLGAAVAGPLAAAFGTAAVLTVGGALIVVLPVLVLAAVPEIRRLRGPDPRPVGGAGPARGEQPPIGPDRAASTAD